MSRQLAQCRLVDVKIRDLDLSDGEGPREIFKGDIHREFEQCERAALGRVQARYTHGIPTPAMESGALTGKISGESWCGDPVYDHDQE
jgi:hypothetical protein